MSWDIFVQDLPRDAATVADIPHDFRPTPLGPRSHIIEKICEVVPTADFSNPAWGIIEGGDWSIEVNLGEAKECKSFAFHVRGADEAVGAVASILDHLGLRALDSQTGEFFMPGSMALASFQKWRAYRDRAVHDGG
ncbi:MAG TPA: hypothetical protein VH253_00165 [Phycisphaerae bacterium]|nr:hypothetical protein [Phycisphaerae bacterium]